MADIILVFGNAKFKISSWGYGHQLIPSGGGISSSNSIPTLNVVIQRKTLSSSDYHSLLNAYIFTNPNPEVTHLYDWDDYDEAKYIFGHIKGRSGTQPKNNSATLIEVNKGFAAFRGVTLVDFYYRRKDSESYIATESLISLKFKY